MPAGNGPLYRSVLVQNFEFWKVILRSLRALHHLLSLSLTVGSSTTGRFPNVRHDNAHRGTAFDDLAQHRRIRSIPSKLNGTAVARDEGSRSAIRAITRGTGRRIMVGCNW